MVSVINEFDQVDEKDGYHANEIAFDEVAPGFIYHPTNTTLTMKAISRLPELTEDEVQSGKSNLGLCFFSEKKLSTGMLIKLTIPLRGEDHIFIGQIVIVKESQQGYEVGIWLRSQVDAYRARIVEQACFLEGVMKKKQTQKSSRQSKKSGLHSWVLRNNTRRSAARDVVA